MSRFGHGSSSHRGTRNVDFSCAWARAGNGSHICLRAGSKEMVDAFHEAAIGHGGGSEGAPGLRPAHGEGYYAAFIRDPDGNRIEAVTFVK